MALSATIPSPPLLSSNAITAAIWKSGRTRRTIVSMVVISPSICPVAGDRSSPALRRDPPQPAPACRPAVLRRAGSGGEGGVQAVEVTRHVGGTAAKGRKLVVRPGQPLVGHLLRGKGAHEVVDVKT